LGDISTYIAGNRDRSGGHKSGGLRLDFFDVDAKPYAPAKMAGGCQSRAQHSCHTRWLCAVGLKVLSVFGISLDVFRIVGGTIIAYMGFDMLRGRQTVGQESPTSDDHAAPNSFTPLIMFAAGPGTITTVVTMAAVHTPDELPITAIVAAIVGASVTLAVLLLATEIGPHLGRGTQAVVTRFMGLIVASMGMQFVLAGLKAFLSL